MEDMQFGDTIDCRLAVYGSLAPGQPNHHQLATIQGKWVPGHVRGSLAAEGWGSGLGFPGFCPHDDGGLISVQLFVSRDLPNHLERLDEFEGDDYERTAVSVETADGPVDAWIYAVHPKHAGDPRHTGVPKSAT